MLRGRLLLGKPRTSEPWRWTTSCPGTRAVRTTSATCRPSASAAMPASDGRREAGFVFCALEGSGRVLLENAFEAVHRLCLAGVAWVQPGDPAAACGRWVGVAPAGMERGGGAAVAAAGAAECHGRHDQGLDQFINCRLRTKLNTKFMHHRISNSISKTLR
jgi:hypothetical protein